VDKKANIGKLELKLDVDTEEAKKKLLELEEIADRVAEKIARVVEKSARIGVQNTTVND